MKGANGKSKYAWDQGEHATTKGKDSTSQVKGSLDGTAEDAAIFANNAANWKIGLRFPGHTARHVAMAACDRLRVAAKKLLLSSKSTATCAHRPPKRGTNIVQKHVPTIQC